MRDKRFIAEHRGGPLIKEQHNQLITWACDCAEQVVPLFGEPIDDRLKNALLIAREWAQGDASTGDAMKGSLSAHSVARASSDLTAIAVARSVGQAAATAQIADHAWGAAWYALKAVNLAHMSVDAERRGQDEHLLLEIKDLVLTARNSRKI